MRKTVVLALAAALALAVRPLHAQFGPELPDPTDLGLDSQFAAYFALTSSPFGVLPPLLSAPAPAIGQRGIGLRAQFGQITDPVGGIGGFDISRRIVAGGLDIPVGLGTLGLTGGYLDYGCDEISEQIDFDGDGVNDFGVALGCKSGMTGAATWSMPLIATAPGEVGGTGWLLGLDAGVGMSSGDLFEVRVSGAEGFPFNVGVKLGASTLTAGVGLPMGLVVRSGGVTVVPHLLPRLAWGRTELDLPNVGELPPGTDDSPSESAVRFMLGGGVGLQFSGTGLGMHVGMQKVFVDEGKLAVGVGLSWAMR